MFLKGHNKLGTSKKKEIRERKPERWKGGRKRDGEERGKGNNRTMYPVIKINGNKTTSWLYVWFDLFIHSNISFTSGSVVISETGDTGKVYCRRTFNLYDYLIPSINPSPVISTYLLST